MTRMIMVEGSLLNAKQEMFARKLAMGLNLTDAYVAAGYSYNPANAHTLAKQPNVAERVKELIAEGQRKIADLTERNENAEGTTYKSIGITKLYVMLELKDNVKLAREIGNIPAANKALELMGKELGMFKDSAKGDAREEIDKPQTPLITMPLDVMNAMLEKIGMNPDAFESALDAVREPEDDLLTEMDSTVLNIEKINRESV